ncbi:MAG: hypothetical protein ACJ72N_03085 [Labedaea sp.]
MDAAWAVVGLTASMCVALSWAIWCLVASARQERRWRAVRHHASSDQTGAIDGYERPIHRFRGQGEAITVAELLEEAIERGEGIRLSWPTEDTQASPIQADELGQWPTAVLPRVEDDE